MPENGAALWNCVEKETYLNSPISSMPLGCSAGLQFMLKKYAKEIFIDEEQQ
jgi:hypothetical protein